MAPFPDCPGCLDPDDPHDLDCPTNAAAAAAGSDAGWWPPPDYSW
jgi:hypothetical protein